MSRVYNIETWVTRLRKLCPITAISLELVKFDTQAMLSPEISGVEYQQGELLGYEVREPNFSLRKKSLIKRNNWNKRNLVGNALTVALRTYPTWKLNISSPRPVVEVIALVI